MKKYKKICNIYKSKNKKINYLINFLNDNYKYKKFNITYYKKLLKYDNNEELKKTIINLKNENKKLKNENKLLNEELKNKNHQLYILNYDNLKEKINDNYELWNINFGFWLNELTWREIKFITQL